jgi:hypothetical protein
MGNPQQQYDLFISHASEDKEEFVRPLAGALVNLGVSVWFDDFSLRVGDSLSRSIDQGLAGSRFGVVVLSRAFIQKRWTEYELRGLIAREAAGGGNKIILPIWHGVTHEEVLTFRPPLADKRALDTRHLDAEAIALQLLQEIRPDIYASHPRADLQRLASGEMLETLRDEIEQTRIQLEEAQEELSEFQCPTCSARLESKTVVPLDDPYNDGYLFERYECGYESSEGYMSRPCPYDPHFPNPEDYELTSSRNYALAAEAQWSCFAKPKTHWARLIDVPHGFGATQEEAEASVRRHLPRRRTPD